MKKRSIRSFQSWKQAEEQELEAIRKTSPEERMEILNALIELQKELPKSESFSLVEEVPVIYRNKNK
jgi:hypothetical protein